MQESFLPNFSDSPPSNDGPIVVIDKKWAGWEFLICLAPSYIFFILGFWRGFQIRHMGHPAREPDFRPYHIVKWLSIGMSCSYVLKFLIGLYDLDLVNLEDDDLKYCILYSFPVVSWYWAYWLTLMEVKRKVMPLDHDQPMFWALSALASFIKLIFESKTFQFERSFDFVQFALSSMVFYQYYSHSAAFMKYMDEFAEGPQMSENLLRGEYGIEIESLKKYNNKKKPKINEALPEIKSKIAKKISKKQTGYGVMEDYFEISVQVNNQKIEKVDRSLKEFTNLDEELRLIYNLVNFPRISGSLPMLDEKLIERFVVESNTDDHYELIEHLEEYLNNLAHNPIYMHEVVLDFLRIPDPHRKLFIRYFTESEQKHLQSPQRSIILLRHSSSAKKSDIELNNFDSPNKPVRSSTLKETNANLQAIHLEVHRVNMKNRYKKRILYEYKIDMIKENDVAISWTISRTLNSFKKNHQLLEKQLEVKVPSIKRFLPDLGEEDEGNQHWEGILQGLEKYLKTVLSVKKFYCPILMEFLGLDPVTLEPKDIYADLKSDSSIAEE